MRHMKRFMREQKKHYLYVLGIAEKVQFRHCKPGSSRHCERSEAISVIRSF